MTATALLLLVPLSAAPPTAPAAETAITERQVAEWVADLRGTDSTKRQAAYEAFRNAGPKAKSAVPELTKMLGDTNLPYYYAADVLGTIGPDAKPAVPALLALIPKEGGGGFGTQAVALALARIDSPNPEATRALLLGVIRCTPNLLVGSQVLHDYPAQVIPHVVALCEHKEPHVRMKAAEFLGTLKGKEPSKVPTKTLLELAGDGAKGVGPALEKLLADPNRDVRLIAARATSHVAPELTDKSLAVVVQMGIASTNTKSTVHATDVFYPVPQQAMKVLLPLLDDPRDAVRWWAVTHISPLPITEPIEDVLKNGKTPRAREGAAMALGNRYSGGAASVSALKDALGDSEFVVRFAAALALVQVGPKGGAGHSAAIPVLIEGLQQKNEDTRIKASQNLLQTGPTAKSAVPALTTLLEDKKPEVRFEAALALVGIDLSKAAAGVPALIEGVKTDNDRSVLRAAKALAVLGPVAKDAVPALLAKCDTKAPQWRLYAAEAVARIDAAQTSKAVEVLVGLLKEKKSNVRQAIAALRRIGPGAKPAMPTLTELLSTKNYDHAEVAVAMLVIDPEGAKPALEWVRKVLSDQASEDLYDLTELLPELGPAAKPLIPELVALAQSKTLYQRERAIEALGAIGPDAKAALPELKKIAESDQRPRVRTAVAEAVKKIEASK